jgi:hypothetical protein
MTEKFGRDFPQRGLAALEKRPDWWQDLLQARFDDAQGDKRPLFLAVRKNYLNAYVQGQSIAKITFKNAVPACLCADIHHKFVIEGAKGQKFLRWIGSDGADIDYTGPAMLDRWIKKAQTFTKEEKVGVASIADNNSHVIDVEMALPGAASRIDMVALERYGKDIRIAFYEAKCFSNPSLVSNTRPKVLDQLEKYASWLGAEGRSKLVADCYRRTCHVLIALREMQKQSIHPLVLEAAREDSNLIIDAAPRLVIFGYDPDKLSINWQNRHRPALEAAGLHGARLIMAPSAGDIRLPDGQDSDFSISDATDIAYYLEGPEAMIALELGGLARFADIFSAPGFSFGQWSQAETLANGLIVLPGYNLSDEGRSFHKTVYELGWVTRFQWSEWMETPTAKALFANAAGVAKASVEDLRCMLTALVRGERFCEGTLANAFKQGILTAIVQRARVLLNEVERAS